MRIFTCIILLFFVTHLFCQYQDGFKLLSQVPAYKLRPAQDTNVYAFIKALDSNSNVNYLENLSKIVINKDELLRTNSRSQFFQEEGTLLSFIGDYERAFFEFDSCDYNSDKNEANSIAEFVQALKGITYKDARQAILDSAKQHKIVMINEAHHYSRNRELTYSLLNDLYKIGYRYFGLEALGPYRYNQKNTISVTTSYYTLEPIMADLIRYAGEIGYTVFPYEAMSGSPLARDSIQAKNIAAVVGNFANGKLLIHAGYGHIAEKNFGVPALGNILKEMLQIDPFTVNQIDFIEGRRNNITQGLYNFIANQNQKKDVQPLAMLKNGKSYQVSDDSLYDIFIYTPPSIYENGRPTWLAANGIKKKNVIKLPFIKGEKVILAQAYFWDETNTLKLNKCIPADQSYIFNNGSVNLYLRKGRYLLVFRDANYNIIRQKVYVVDN